MKIMLRAAIAALSIGTIGSAHADGGPGETMFTRMQAEQQKKAPRAAAAQDGGAAVPAYVTRSNQGTYLFPPAQGGNG
jgi:hypothetical protein